jgi:hypothetical protein
MHKIRLAVFQACVGVSVFLAGATSFATISPPTGLRTVALSGTPAPDAGSGVNFQSFVDVVDRSIPKPVVNASGQVAFIPLLSSFIEVNGTDFYDSAVYSEGGGSLSLIARAGAHPPGTFNNTTYNSFGNLNLNDHGTLAYTGYLIGISAIDQAIFSNRTGTTSIVARYQDHAVGYPTGVVYNVLFGAQLNNAGQMAFGAYPSVTSPSQYDPYGAIYSEVGARGFQLVARSGDPAPGIPGTNYGGMGTLYSRNNLGDLVFAAEVGATSTFGLWSKKPGGPVTLIIRDGDPAPGLPGLTVPSYGVASIGGAESILLGGKLQGPLVTTDNDDAMYYMVHGQVALLAREGQQAFGLPSGVLFGDPSPSVVPIGAFLAGKTNVKGDVLFRAQLRGTGVSDGVNDAGLWEGNATDGFHMVARRGTSIGAFPGGTLNVIEDTALNDLGQFAYLAGFNSPSGRYTAIMATDIHGNLMEIARTGEQIDVDNGPGVDLRTISSFFDDSDPFNSDENLISLGSTGYIAFSVGFTDGSSAILVSSAVAVPEPATLTICALAMCTCVSTQRRKRMLS